MTLYLDTSAFVSLFLQETRTLAVEELVADAAEPVLISDFAEGEFAAAVSTNVRIGRLTVAQADSTIEDAGIWTKFQANPVATTVADIRLAIAFVRKFDLGLLFPDAVHLAICSRVEATLVTGDHRQASAGKALGLDIIDV